MIRSIAIALLLFSTSLCEAAVWRPGYEKENCRDTCEYFNLAAVSSGKQDYNGIDGEMFVCRSAYYYKAGYQAEAHYYNKWGCTIADGGDELRLWSHQCLCE